MFEFQYSEFAFIIKLLKLGWNLFLSSVRNEMLVEQMDA